MVCKTQHLFIGDLDSKIVSPVNLVFNLSFGSQTNNLTDPLHQGYNLSHSILMLRGFIIEQQPWKGFDKSKCNLRLLVRERGVAGDEESIGKQGSLSGQWSPVADLLQHNLDFHHLIKFWHSVCFWSDQSVPLNQLVCLDSFNRANAGQPEDNVGGGEGEGGGVGGGDLQHQGGRERRSVQPAKKLRRRHFVIARAVSDDDITSV